MAKEQNNPIRANAHRRYRAANGSMRVVRHGTTRDPLSVASARSAFADSLDNEDGIEYPSSDGKPMAETELHILAMIQLFQILRGHFDSRPDAYVIANMLWYWQKGEPKACSSPDVMVVFGVNKRVRRSFRSWNEGGAIPAVTFEMASRGTWRRHIRQNRAEYELLGVKEYFIFDPQDAFLKEPLLGWRHNGKRYVEIATEADGSMLSRELNLKLNACGTHLRPADPTSGELLLTVAEREAAAQQTAQDEKRRRLLAERRTEEECRRADSLARELKRLRAELRPKKPRS
jgi:Uma2 family endonuclease